MSKLIQQYSYRQKIVFWPWEGVFFIEMKNFKKQKSFILCLAPPVLWVGPKSKFCILSDPPTQKKNKKHGLKMPNTNRAGGALFSGGYYSEKQKKFLVFHSVFG